MNSKYRICSHCIMDTSDPDIRFDMKGVCNHCREYEKLAEEMLLPLPEREWELERTIEKIKKWGRGREYDAIIGLSGGVDSSYLAFLAKKHDLRLLPVHFDNGWNSETSVRNVENIVKKLGFDLYTYVVNWEEFRDLQRAFFKASVLDIEMLTDHAILAVLYSLARKNRIKYILSGTNVVSEAILPQRWNYRRKTDLRNIKAIQKRYGTKQLKTFPMASTFRIAWHRYGHGIETAGLLNYVDYNREEAIGTLKKEMGWKPYGGKHCESVFTRFYQSYILPVKFGIDKRRAHLSNLVCSGQVSRAEALEAIMKDPYPPEQMREEKEYVIKKLGFTDDEFEGIMKMPVCSHYEYATDEKMFKVLIQLKSLLRSLKVIRKAGA